MVKKKGFYAAIFVILVFASVNVFLFLNNDGVSYSSISGMYLKDFSEASGGLDFSIIAFIGQWIILLFVFFSFYFRFLGGRKTENLKSEYNQLKNKKSKVKTDLDTLYLLLKNKKKLNIDSISKTFGVTNEKALEWAKILENSDLVKVEYPAFSSPEVKINEKEKV